MNTQSKRKSFLDFLRNLSGIKRKSAGERKIKGDIMKNENKTTETTTATETTKVDMDKKPEPAVKEETQTQDTATETQDTAVETQDQAAPAPEQPTEEPQVADTAAHGNGIDINDLVTKDDLAQMMAAFEAKYGALAKENEDLKAQVSELQTKNEQIRSKYEDNGDFGGAQAQGVSVDNRSAYETFEEYSARFRR